MLQDGVSVRTIARKLASLHYSVVLSVVFVS